MNVPDLMSLNYLSEVIVHNGFVKWTEVAAIVQHRQKAWFYSIDDEGMTNLILV